MNSPPDAKRPGRPEQPGGSGPAEAGPASADAPESCPPSRFEPESFRCRLCNRIMTEGLPGAPPAPGLCLLCTAEFGGPDSGFN